MIINDSDSKIRLFFQDCRKLLFSGLAGEGIVHYIHALGFIRGNCHRVGLMDHEYFQFASLCVLGFVATLVPARK